MLEQLLMPRVCVQYQSDMRSPVTNGRVVTSVFLSLEFVCLFQLLSVCFAPAAFPADPVMS